MLIGLSFADCYTFGGWSTQIRIATVQAAGSYVPLTEGMAEELGGWGELVLGSKQPAPEGAAQNPGGQVQAVPFQCSMMAVQGRVPLRRRARHRKHLGRDTGRPTYIRGSR